MNGNARYSLDTSGMDALLKNAPDALMGLLRSAAEEMVTEMKLSMGTSAPGRVYRRGTVEHVASVPGAPPTPDTGALRASLKWKATGELEITISDGVEYGVWLEFGTENMKARPWMGPVFASWKAGKFQDLARSMKLI